MPYLIGIIVTGAAVLFLNQLAGTPAGRRSIASAATSLFAWGMRAFYVIAPVIAVEFTKGIMASFEAHKDLWAQVVSIFVEEFTGQSVDVNALSAQLQGGGLGAAAPAVGAPLIQAVLQLLGGSDTMTPDSAEKNL